jgi:DNA replicative helicase MCM subunit Mcm2 (Cdc46/Mcm family)
MKTADWQKVRVQELLTATQQGQQSAVRTIEVELFADCVNSCMCGDSVSIVGFVRVMSVDAATAGKGKSGVMLMYLDAVSAVNHTMPSGRLTQQVRTPSMRCSSLADYLTLANRFWRICLRTLKSSYIF